MNANNLVPLLIKQGRLIKMHLKILVICSYNIFLIICLSFNSYSLLPSLYLRALSICTLSYFLRFLLIINKIYSTLLTFTNRHSPLTLIHLMSLFHFLEMLPYLRFYFVLVTPTKPSLRICYSTCPLWTVSLILSAFILLIGAPPSFHSFNHISRTL